jgi:methionyl-tRNA formyltransferase
MRTLFMGTPEIAVPTLKALAECSEVVAVVCQPDRPAGRGLELKPPAVKLCALELGIAVKQPDKVRTRAFVDWVETLEVDVVVVIAYGKILGPRLLSVPRRGCMNLHASLLPRHRGAAPINWVIVGGDTETGISLMQMDEGCDTGPVFSRHRLDIGPDETAGELYQRLGELAAEVVRTDLARAVDGTLEATAQHDAEATHAPMLKKSDGTVDWSKAAASVHDLVRGMTPWPGAHTSVGGKRFKLLSTRLAERDGSLGEPGTVLAIGSLPGVDGGAATIACGRGSVHLLRGQIAGKKALGASQLAAGRTLAVGTVLGSA